MDEAQKREVMQEMGRRGGNETLRRHGRDYYRRIGLVGGRYNRSQRAQRLRVELRLVGLEMRRVMERLAGDSVAIQRAVVLAPLRRRRAALQAALADIERVVGEKDDRRDQGE